MTMEEVRSDLVKTLANKPSIVEDVRRVMPVSDVAYDAAKLVSMEKNSYSFIRRLIVLSDMSIPNDEKDKIKRVFDEIEEKGGRTVRVWRRYQSFYPAEELVRKYWYKNKLIQQQKKEKFNQSQKYRRIDQTLIHIRESCESTVDMEIPIDMSEVEIKKAIATLSSSVELISRLIRRLTGESDYEE